MSETMKAAWIGLVGAILGAVLAVIGATHYSDWLYGPKEGVFSADLTSINASNIDPTLREQITRYPCSLIVRHINGPSIQNITISIQSKYPLDSLNMVRNDENAEVVLSDDKRRLRVDIHELRKGSSVHYDFVSLGTPELEKTVTMSSGRLADTLQQQPEPTPWYKTDTFFIAVFLLGYAILFLIIFIFVGRSIFTESGALNLSKKGLRNLALVIAVLSILPFPFHVSDAFIIIMLAVIYTKLEEGKV